MKKIKQTILDLVKEAVEEYRTKGALGQHNPNRKLPVKATGLNYKVKNVYKNNDILDPTEPLGLKVFLASEEDPKKADLIDYDFLNNTQGAARNFIESNIMAHLGDDALNAKVSNEVYQAIEKGKENDLDGKLTPQNNTIVLYVDRSKKPTELRAKTKLNSQVKEIFGFGKKNQSEPKTEFPVGEKSFKIAFHSKFDSPNLKKDNVHVLEDFKSTATSKKELMTNIQDMLNSRVLNKPNIKWTVLPQYFQVLDYKVIKV